MAVLVLLLAAIAPPAFAFAAPEHSTARAVLAWSAFYWLPVVIGVTWLVATNYAMSITVEGENLRLRTLRGRRVLDLRRLDRMRSLSLWGQYGPSHAFRLHTDDGEHAIVFLAGQLTSLNRRNVERAHRVRDALAPYADLADPRGRYWLGVGPRPSRVATAQHVIVKMLTYLVIALIAVVAIAAFINTAAD